MSSFKKFVWRMYLFFIIVGCLFSSQAQGTALQLSGSLQPGKAVLLQLIDFPVGSKLSGSLGGEAFPITPEGAALLALDMEVAPGEKTLQVRIQPPKGKEIILTQKIKVAKRVYQEEHLTLPEKKVQLVKEDSSRAERETQAIKESYKRRGGQVGYVSLFQQPVAGRFSGIFGSRRILNGKPRAPHNGVDIAAPKGTPVKNIAPGQVALVGNNYFFTGNTLILDHGDGVISLYAHLDSIVVAEGAWIPKNTTIGFVGMTGRATGPHLHWGVLVRGNRVDPMLLPGIVQE
ncbi:MAG: M23 family metallopeptidase [Magnetococcus sp. DMHC-6]